MVSCDSQSVTGQCHVMRRLIFYQFWSKTEYSSCAKHDSVSDAICEAAELRQTFWNAFKTPSKTDCLIRLWRQLIQKDACSSMRMRAHCEDKKDGKRGTANGGAEWRRKERDSNKRIGIAIKGVASGGERGVGERDAGPLGISLATYSTSTLSSMEQFIQTQKQALLKEQHLVHPSSDTYLFSHILL